MGVFSGLKIRRDQQAVADGIQASIFQLRDPSNMPYASPWQTSQLQRWVYEDIFGEIPETTRDACMRIGAFARARNLICTSIGKLPLVEVDASTQTPLGAAHWMTHTGDGSTPQARMVWTVDDLMFYGQSCWWRDKAGTEEETRSRLNLEDWEIDSDKRQILVNGSPAGPNEIMLFTGFHEGVLRYGREVVRDTRKLYEIVRGRLKNPVPMLNLQQTDGRDLTDVEIDKLIERWAAARNGENAGVSFSNKYIKPEALGGGDDGALLIESRNAAAVDAARIIGVSAGQIDATTPKASLNYETQAGRNEEFTDLDLDLYLEPIAARLSLDDSCAPGHRVAFDRGQFTTLTPSPLGQPTED